MYISELMTIAQVIINNIPVFLVMVFLVAWLDKKINQHVKETKDMWMHTNQRLDNLYSELISLRKEIK